MHILLLYDKYFSKRCSACTHFVSYTSVLLLCSAGGGGDCEVCGIVPPSSAVPPSVVSGVCHAKFCSSSLFTFFLLKKPNFV